MRSDERVIRYRLGRHDLLRTRFAISPLIELAAATYVLRLPRQFPEHRLWVEDVAPRVAGLDVGLLYAASPLGRSAWPNFDAPPPVVPHPRIEGRTGAARGHRPGARAVGRAARVPRRRAGRRASVSSMTPRRLSRASSTQSRSFWDAALEPWWPRMSGFLESEIAARARRLVATGSVAAFADLDPHRDVGRSRPDRLSRGDGAARRGPGRSGPAPHPVGAGMGRLAPGRSAVGPGAHLPATRGR